MPTEPQQIERVEGRPTGGQVLLKQAKPRKKIGKRRKYVLPEPKYFVLVE